jgi:hypothetical protein
MPLKNPAAVALGRLGGKVKSVAKTLAARANAKKKRRRTMKTAIIFLAALLLTGCAERVWYNSTVSMDQARRDSYECQRDATNLIGQNLSNTLIAFRMASECMESKGYERVNRADIPQ